MVNQQNNPNYEILYTVKNQDARKIPSYYPKTKGSSSFCYDPHAITFENGFPPDFGEIFFRTISIPPTFFWFTGAAHGDSEFTADGENLRGMRGKL